MITPRQTRLLRARDLQSFQHGIAEAIGASSATSAGCAVLVPSRAAAKQLHRTLRRLPCRAAIVPLLLTRQDWYRRMHERLPAVPPMLSAADRELLLTEAARTAEADDIRAPFATRPGLIAEMLAFYDVLRRQQRSLDDFQRLAVGELEPIAGIDHGAARMLEQTRFLIEAFARFERRVEATGRLDEHGLRQRLLAEAGRPAFTHLIVTVADQAVSGDGLWLADFDLLARMPAVAEIDIVETEALLASGYHERLHDLLPGIDEVRIEAAGTTPSLLVPADQDGALHFTSRDREEELWAVARRVQASREELAQAGGSGTASVAVVFQRPLPYVYLAEHVFDASRVAFETFHGVPLAAEPYAALVDLLLEAVASGFARGALLAVLRSPHLRTGIDEPLSGRGVERLARRLQASRYAGGLDHLARVLAGGWEGAEHDDDRMAAVVLAIVAALSPIGEAGTAATQWDRLLEFLERWEAPVTGDGLDRERQLRAREAVLGAVRELRSAAAKFSAAAVPVSELRARLRRRLEPELFARRPGNGGVQLVETSAARYGRFAHVHVVGLIDGDWPPGARRNIFYPASLLRQLGWPVDGDRPRTARAEFADLLRLPTAQVVLSTFQLEDDTVVTPTGLLEDVGDAGLPAREETSDQTSRISIDERLLSGAGVPSEVSGETASWLAVRVEGSAGDELPGTVGAVEPRRYAVSRVERYLDCPFKYFSAAVLRLDEEAVDEPTLDRRGRGEVLHLVLRTLVERWHAAGHHGFGEDQIDAALACARDVVEEAMDDLPAVDRQLERARLLGSASSAGLVERFVRLESERSGDAVESLLERTFDGTFSITGASGASRQVRLRGVADRVDLLADGTLRLLDYKLGRAPNAGRAVQLPVYAACAEQALAGYRRRTWSVAEASYVAFGGSRLEVPVISRGDGTPSSLGAGQARFLEAIDGIERGAFPPAPAEDRLCASCGFTAVCRKGRAS